MLDPTDARLVLELFDVRCLECDGTGHVSIREGRVGFPEHGYRPFCTNCKSDGYHLSGATRENWPWWIWDGTGFRDDYPPNEEPYIPDFPNDDGAAVKLAAKLIAMVTWCGNGEHVVVFEIVYGRDFSEFDLGKRPNGPTLGAALIAALRAGKGDEHAT